MRRRVDATHFKLQRLRGMTLEEITIAIRKIPNAIFMMTIRVNFPGMELRKALTPDQTAIAE